MKDFAAAFGKLQELGAFPQKCPVEKKKKGWFW